MRLRQAESRFAIVLLDTVIGCCANGMPSYGPNYSLDVISQYASVSCFTCLLASRPPGSLQQSPSHTTRSSSRCRRVDVESEDLEVCATKGSARVRWTKVPKCGVRPGTRIRLWWLRARRECSLRRARIFSANWRACFLSPSLQDYETKIKARASDCGWT